MKHMAHPKGLVAFNARLLLNRDGHEVVGL